MNVRKCLKHGQCCLPSFTVILTFQLHQHQQNYSNGSWKKFCLILLRYQWTHTFWQCGLQGVGDQEQWLLPHVHPLQTYVEEIPDEKSWRGKKTSRASPGGLLFPSSSPLFSRWTSPPSSSELNVYSPGTLHCWLSESNCESQNTAEHESQQIDWLNIALKTNTKYCNIDDIWVFSLHI